jgi:hypothetical protein
MDKDKMRKISRLFLFSVFKNQVAKFLPEKDEEEEYDGQSG